MSSKRRLQQLLSFGLASLSNVEKIEGKKLLAVSLCIVNGVIKVNKTFLKSKVNNACTTI